MNNAWEVNTEVSTNCPYNSCDGSGIILLVNTLTLEKKMNFCRCYEERLNERILNKSNIPTSMRDLKVSDFSIMIYSDSERKRAKIAKKVSANYVKHFPVFKEKGKGLYFYSSTKGSGKTRLAISVANALRNLYKVEVLYMETSKMLETLKQAFNQTNISTQEIKQELKEIDLLILDNMGLEKVSTWMVEVLEEILNYRMEHKKITFFISPFNAEELCFDTYMYERDHDTDRIVSRIKKISIEIQLPEENIRNLEAEKENNDLSSLLYEGVDL